MEGSSVSMKKKTFPTASPVGSGQPSFRGNEGTIRQLINQLPPGVNKSLRKILAALGNHSLLHSLLK